MAILKVARMGHPILRSTAQPIPKGEIRSGRVQRLIEDMIETMHEYDGAGLAAPQVHAPVRLVVIEVPGDNEQGREGIPLTVMINPIITPKGEEQSLGFEGCLSLPDLKGLVPRFNAVQVEYTNPEGKTVTQNLEGFFARVVQHECDHLDGILYVDRMQGLKTLAFGHEFDRFLLPHLEAGADEQA